MNVHGLRDLREGQSNNNLRPQAQRQRSHGLFQDMDPLSLQNLKCAQQHKVLFLSGRRRVKHPQQQTYFDMLSQICCPTIKLLSFTSLIIVITSIMYIVQLSMGLEKQSDFLQIDMATLKALGANYAPYIQKGQIYRLLAPIFLHVNFLHFFGNLLAIFMFVSRIEYTYGPLKTAIIYILSGIGGNIFSALIDSKYVKAGASTSLYGIIGVIIGYLILNWSGLNLVGLVLKCQLVCTSLMIVSFIFFFSVIGTTNLDTMGHLGGFLTGIWLSSIKQTIIDGKCQKVLRIILFSLFIIQFIICFVVFYTK